MPLSPIEAEERTKQYESILIEKLTIDYERVIDKRLSTSFAAGTTKIQVNLTFLNKKTKVVQDGILSHLKKDYEDMGWKTWSVQEKSSQVFYFTLETGKAKE